jgi:N utilization substance protein B
MKITRRQAREITLCLVFDFGFNSDEKPEELLDLYITYFPETDEEKMTEQIRENEYISNAYFGVAENITQLDEVIANCSLKWKTERISRVCMSILRLAVYELLYMDEIPSEVTVNEAVELAKKYDTDDSYTFVNGVLGAVIKNVLPGRTDINE